MHKGQNQEEDVYMRNKTESLKLEKAEMIKKKKEIIVISESCKERALFPSQGNCNLTC